MQGTQTTKAHRGGSPRGAKQTPGNARLLAFRPPAAGPDFNARLVAALEKRLAGDPRSQVALLCKYAELGEANADPHDDRKRRYELGEVLQGSLTALARVGVRPQRLNDISPRNAATAVRAWRQRGDSEGTLGWKVAVLRRFFRLLGRHAPHLTVYG